MADLQQQVKEKAALAVEQFQRRAEGPLDYSSSSLAVIEEMLSEASDFYEDMPAERAEALSELIGSYILHVAFTEHSGKFYWSDKNNQPVLVVGEPEFKVSIMTFGKVHGRLSGDEADNIPFFYKGFSERVKTAEKGIEVLYI